MEHHCAVVNTEESKTSVLKYTAVQVKRQAVC